MSEKILAEFTKEYKSIVIIPDTSLDSLLASSILFKKLLEYGLDVRVSINAKILIDYPNDPAIVVGLPVINKDKQLAITSTSPESSTTGVVVSMLDKLVGIDYMDKLISIIAGLYRDLYDFKSGAFKGVENEYLKSLVNEKRVVEVAGLRLWGVRRVGTATALARTLLPYIPGFTGNISKALKIVSDAFKTQDPSSIREKEIKPGENKDLILTFLKLLTESTKDTSLVYRLLGDFYVTLQIHNESIDIELHELLGALIVSESLCYECPLDIAITALDKSMLIQFLILYDTIIDELALNVGSIFENLRRGELVELPGKVKRPDILIDILSYTKALPRDKALVVNSEIGSITVLRELIRVGVKPEKVYESCREDQICPLK
ncbi:MAG: phosphoesterase [Desulfurococcaceae archaeon]